MKKINYLLIICFLAFSAFSCDGDKEPEQNDDLPGAFVATVDGEMIDFRYKPRATVGTYNNIPAIFLDGRTPDFTKELNISIVNLNGIGTYNLGSVEGNTGYFESSPSGGGLVTSYGTSAEALGVVNVTAYSGSSIQGDFSFDAFGISANDTIQISGTFNLSITD